MTDKKLRSKSQLKSLFTNLIRKGITDDMMSILIDVLWRNKPIMRTSGFEIAGGADSVFSWDNATRTFSIVPLDPVFAGYIPKYSFFSWSNQAHIHTVFDQKNLILPDEEGLFAIYFSSDDVLRTQTLHYLKNPTRSDLKQLYLKKVLISFVYWDATNKTAVHAGNDRHGSEWNPQQHWQQHRSFQAQKDSGLIITGMQVNKDGSNNADARFNVTAGDMWHDDFLISIPEVPADATIPIMYFSTANVPRFIEQPGFGILHGTNRIKYNLNSNSTADADNGYFVVYHVFSTNEHFIDARKIISVMGQDQYDTLAAAYSAINSELDTVFQYMPQQGRCHLGSLIFQTDDAYTNTPHARIVGFVGDTTNKHLPVSIDDSSEYLEIDEEQKLSFIPGKSVNQVAHGFTVENAIRHNGTSFVKTQADTAENAQTCGVVSKVIDVDNFEYQSDGFLPGNWTPGAEYFLSPITAGLLTTLSDPEIWNIGEVRQHIGTGTLAALKIEIDVGDEIGIAAESGGNISIAIDDDVPLTDENLWYQPTTGILNVLVDEQWVSVGTVGSDGINGEPGSSAYEVWVSEGNSGTEQDFLDSLVGPAGSTATSRWTFRNGALEPTTASYLVRAVNFLLLSERKLKKNIEPFENKKWVDSIEFRKYIFKNDPEQRVRYGVIVDEVEKVAPELIHGPEGNKSVAYIDLLVAKVARLEEEVRKLKTRI